MLQSPRLLVCAAGLLWVVACSSNPADPEPNGGAAGEAASAGNGSGGQGTAEPAACPEGTNPPSEPKPTAVGVVAGQLVDDEGNPTSAGLVQICGKDVCINARVGSDGTLLEDVAKATNSEPMDAPACKFGDGLTWGKLAIPLEAGNTQLGTLTSARLPDFADSLPFTPGATISSGGVTLTLAPDASVEVDTLTYEDEMQQGFRAVALSEAALLPLDQDFVAGFALSPVETRICPSPALSLENQANLAPGTALELYVLGVNVRETLVPYGQWQKVGEGQVSADGATLEFPDGLPLLTAIGIREKG